MQGEQHERRDGGGVRLDVADQHHRHPHLPCTHINKHRHGQRHGRHTDIQTQTHTRRISATDTRTCRARTGTGTGTDADAETPRHRGTKPRRHSQHSLDQGHRYPHLPCRHRHRHRQRQRHGCRHREREAHRNTDTSTLRHTDIHAYSQTQTDQHSRHPNLPRRPAGGRTHHAAGTAGCWVGAAGCRAAGPPGSLAATAGLSPRRGGIEREE